MLIFEQFIFVLTRRLGDFEQTSLNFQKQDGSIII